MKNDDLPIVDKVLETLKGKEGKTFKRHEIIKMVIERFPGTNNTSIIPSDYCYNITNLDAKANFQIFEWLSRGIYKYLGENYDYNGVVYWKGTPIGESKKGKLKRFSHHTK